VVFQSSSTNHHHSTHSAKTKSKKTKSLKHAARSDGEGLSPAPTRTKKSKKKKVTSTGGDQKSKQAAAAAVSDTEEKSSVSADSLPTETLRIPLSSVVADASKPPHLTVRSSVPSGVSPKRPGGPRTPPGPQPLSVWLFYPASSR